MSWTRVARSVAVVALVVAGSTVARAHVGHVVRSAERYLKIDVTGGTLRVVVSLSLGPGEMARVLDAADEDRDGEVTRGEADAYMATWSDALARDLPVVVDDERVELDFGQPFVEPIGVVRAAAGTVEMIGEHRLDGGLRVVRVSDRMRRDPFDRTDVTFSARDGAVLRASGADEAVTPPIEALAFGREGPTELLVQVEVPESNAGSGHALLVAAVTAALTLAAVLAIRRFRQVRGGRGT